VGSIHPLPLTFEVRIDLSRDSVKIELELSSHVGDHNYAGCLPTAMHVINAIPHVWDALPGVRTYLDLPVYSARHLLA
jgi:4-hydroxy-tetrahydrodipicolinate reductase